MSGYEPEDYWTLRYEEFDISSSGHRDLPTAYNAWLYKMKKKKIGAAVSAEFDNYAASKVIELGCGTGVYVDMWKTYGVRDLTGLDIAQNAVEQLKKNFPDYQFHAEDLSDRGLAKRYGEEQYSLVTVIGVLVHIVDDDLFHDAVQNIGKLVSKDGIVLVSDYVVRTDIAERRTHMKLRASSRFQKEFENSGLELVKQIPLYFFMIAPFDMPSRLGRFFLPRIYSRLNNYIHRFPNFMGNFLYVVDLLITSFLKTGPSEKLFVYRKKT